MKRLYKKNNNFSRLSGRKKKEKINLDIIEKNIQRAKEDYRDLQEYKGHDNVNAEHIFNRLQKALQESLPILTKNEIEELVNKYYKRDRSRFYDEALFEKIKSIVRIKSEGITEKDYTDEYTEALINDDYYKYCIQSYIENFLYKNLDIISDNLISKAIYVDYNSDIEKLNNKITEELKNAIFSNNNFITITNIDELKEKMKNLFIKSLFEDDIKKKPEPFMYRIFWEMEKEYTEENYPINEARLNWLTNEAIEIFKKRKHIKGSNIFIDKEYIYRKMLRKLDYYGYGLEDEPRIYRNIFNKIKDKVLNIIENIADTEITKIINDIKTENETVLNTNNNQNFSIGKLKNRILRRIAKELK